MENFNSINLPSEIVISLERMNIITPTEIQKKTIPLALQGSDILASSHTGSGKTLAYLLPMVIAIIKNKSRGLILVPTRELAHQVRTMLNKITTDFKISSAVLIGGEPMAKQYAQLKHPPQVVVATPGRLIDHLNQGTIKLNNIKTLILDEMDRMLDMGMKEQVAEINKHMVDKAQVMMFSATMPQDIISFSQKYVNNPERISVGSTTTAAIQIKQETLHISDKEKFAELMKQLTQRIGSAIVFVKTKRSADQLARMLKFENFKADAIHGDLNQNKRERVIGAFSAGRSLILVATDVAARGLDIKHIKHVINYDLPMCAEDYLHRIGRTGRAGAEGSALSFISPEDLSRWKAIDKLMTKGESTKRENIYSSKTSFNKNNRSSSSSKNGPRVRFSDSSSNANKRKFNNSSSSDKRKFGNSSRKFTDGRISKAQF